MKNLRHAYFVLENTNETQQTPKLHGSLMVATQKETPHIFSRRLEELEIINISGELVAYFGKKFGNRVSN
jgi:hypothetical protein